MVTVQNTGEVKITELLSDHVYIAPPYDLFFRFDSDQTTTQVGFELLIQEYGDFY